MRKMLQLEDRGNRSDDILERERAREREREDISPLIWDSWPALNLHSTVRTEIWALLFFLSLWFTLTHYITAVTVRTIDSGSPKGGGGWFKPPKQNLI
jgi:hypothetical protein